jgi:hypothetical protein
LIKKIKSNKNLGIYGVYVMLCACSFIRIAVIFPSPSCLNSIHNKKNSILYTSTSIAVNISTPICDARWEWVTSGKIKSLHSCSRRQRHKLCHDPTSQLLPLLPSPCSPCMQCCTYLHSRHHYFSISLSLKRSCNRTT